jgi:GNAT superfamily N-acetyltransferase
LIPLIHDVRIARMSVRFRCIVPADRADVQAISDTTWGGSDFLGKVFDAWVADPGGRFLGVEVDGRVLGCGRIFPLDRRRGWLEGLRVLESAQGRGLGRRMAHQLFRLGVEEGFETLYFSTYFRNDASIRISEAAGFRPIATCSLVMMDLDALGTAQAAGSGVGAGAGAVETANGSAPEATAPIRSGTDGGGAVLLFPGFRAVPGWMNNDWRFVPGDLESAGRFFPNPAVVDDGRLSMLLADNFKDPRAGLEICWVDGPLDADPAPCLAEVFREARRRGRRWVQAMIPERRALDPFLAAGFRPEERSLDVLLYAARTATLRILED